MADSRTCTPKGTILIKDVGTGMTRDNVSIAGLSTVKVTRGKVAASLQFSDNTLRDVKSMRDVLATVDYKVPLKQAKGVTLNGKYAPATKIYMAGATWNGTIADKTTTLKLSYSNKDKLVAGEATVAVAANNSLNTTFTNKQALTAKWTYVNGDYVFEPTYNFVKNGVTLSATKKVSAKDALKLTYDVNAEAGSLEWNRKPYKVVVSSTVSKNLAIGRPSVSATFEKVYDL